MRTWDDYKKTFPAEGLFDWSRQGDLRSFSELMIDNPGFDLNQKNAKGHSALMLAVYNGQKDFAEALLRCGADANSVDHAGNSILMGACFKGNIPMIKMLLSYGADLKMKNQMNMNAYDWARTFGRKEAQMLFESYGFKKSEGNSLLKNYLNLFFIGIKRAF